jgi:acetyltransferase-like isoleucine patch superfamily enzyme
MEKIIVFCQTFFWFTLSKILYQFRFKNLGWSSYFYGLPIRIMGVNKLSIEKGTIILAGARIEIHNKLNKRPKVRIGESCMIGHGLFISCLEKIEIEDGCLFSDNVAIIDNSHNHVPGESTVTSGLSSKAILIKKNSTIYRNVTILEGVTIGEGSVIGANSIVKNDVKPFSVVVGSPAKQIKSLLH